MNILYVMTESGEKEAFIKEFFNEENLTGQIIKSVNKIDIFIKTILNNAKNSDYVIFDFELFKKNVTTAISAIRSYNNLLDTAFIILSEEIDEKTLNEFHINGFYNLAIIGDKKLMKDIISGNVDEEYMYKNDAEQKDYYEIEDYIFNENVVNIKMFPIDENVSFSGFCYSINFAKYLSSLAKEFYKVYYIDMKDKELDSLSQYELIYPKEDYYLDSQKDDIIYASDSVPAIANKNSNGFFVYYTKKDENIAYDLKIVITDTQQENLQKVKEFLHEDKCLIFVINTFKEDYYKINSILGKDCEKIIYLKNISSFDSIRNDDKYKEILKTDFIEFF